MFQVFILMWIQVGEATSETIIGTGTGGIMNGFLTNNFNGTGRAGKMIDVGKGKELGASRTINLDHNNRYRNKDNKGNSNISRDPMFRNKGNLRFNSQDKCLGFRSHKGNRRFSSQGSLRKGVSSRKGKSKGLRLSNRNILSLRENLKG